MREPVSGGAIVAGTITGFLLLVLTIGGFAFGCPSYNRYQKRANAKNSVKVTSIYVKRQQQEARRVAARDATVKALADQRVIEARGIRRSQEIINATLTPLYVQHEGVKALLGIARSGQNATVIYSPSGTNGVPLVQTPPATQVKP